MDILKGKAISGGIAFGKLYYYKRTQLTLKRHHIEDTDGEIARYHEAKERAVNSLKALYEKALHEAGEHEAAIFEAHQMMLEDLDYEDSVVDIIKKERVNAEFAVGQTADRFAEMFAAMENEYLRGRATDVRDVSEKLISTLLSHADSNLIDSDEPVIVVADDLMPSETVQMDKEKLLGFALLQGSTNSHTAILARTMSIPAVIHLDGQIDESCNGKEAIVDGFSGAVYLEPDAATVEQMKKLRDQHARHLEMLNQLKGKENITKDGQSVRVYANIGHVPDLEYVLENDASGIGLFRSEFLYLDSTDYPTEEEQFSAYKAVLEAMEGKLVIIRTLDIGADKQVDYFELPKEENPAMGFRAIRICLQRPEVFKTQLRALFRASAFGKLGIMFPMIISVEEVQQIKKVVEEVKAGLKAEQVAFAEDVELGIMIETPAAAIISDDLAKEVDFFSIGTNDLTQYTLAVDRQNQELENFYDPHHKAILRLIKRVVENGHKYGTWVGICGELGADPTLTETFLSMGVDELSVSPSKVLEVRAKVREADVGKVKDDILKLIEG
ncbi:MAG: phosphoenolpyruvate--protein phosphotransferase [Ethanoligenens sp.]